jgi:BCD family chlorophyll transporter-like MFS transporter
MRLKRFQLGLIHVAVAMTLLPINSTLNRVMIFDLGISKTLVSILAVLPYLISPIQVAIGSFSDRHPIFGFRRTPYILAGLFLCVTGVVVSPRIAYLIHENFTLGVAAGLLAFGSWGMGYNLSAVCYLSLASELSGEKERGKTIATMFFMMVIGLIGTGIGLSRMLTEYSPAALSHAFSVVGASALTLGLLGVFKLEPRSLLESPPASPENFTVRQMASAITANPVAKVFFVYLLLLLAALLGQDVLLEPFAAQAFGMSVEHTTRLVSISGVFTLIAFILAGALDGRMPKKILAQSGNLGALSGFLLILLSGFMRGETVFYAGIMLLGFGTGISTIANLSLMFDLTVAGKVGLYIGAWGFSNGLSRLVGILLAGVVADTATRVTASALNGYLIVFGIEAMMLFAAAFLLTRIDVAAFRRNVEEQPTFAEKAAMVAD